MSLRYKDGMEIEQFDQVEVTIDGQVYEGFIAMILHRKQQVAVKYSDYINPRRDGEPKQAHIRVPVSQVDLIARDG